MRYRFSVIVVAAALACIIGLACALPADSESGCTSAACIWGRLTEWGFVRDAAGSEVASRRTERGYGGATGGQGQFYAYYERPAYRQPASSYQSSHVAVSDPSWSYGQNVGHRGHNTKQAQLQRGWGRHEEDCWEEEEAPPIGAADIAGGRRRRRRKRSRGRGGGRGAGGCLWELFPDEE